MTETESVATYARIRPYNPAINEDKRLTARAIGDNKIINQNNDREDSYNFTKVFDMKHTNDSVFSCAMKPLLDYKILQGINSIFIVYGQSGSGKSFTLIGEEGYLGLLPLSLQYLLSKDIVERIDISSIEAYGIKAAKIGFYDLVSQLSIKKKHLKTFDAYTSKDNPRLNSSNSQFIQITNKNCLRIITQLQQVSHMAPTLKNPHSSRGHTVYFARVKMKELEDVYFICVDLAGSEGQTALGTKDEFVEGLKLAMTKGKLKLNKKQMKGFEQMYKTRSLEAGCINNGLTQLQTIFRELIKQKISKSQGLGLRKILSSFISLKSAYAILFTMSASANNNKVTKATLNFAKQTQLVKVDTQKAKKKIDKDKIISELNSLIEELRSEMSVKDVTIEELKTEISQSQIEVENKEKEMNIYKESVFCKFDEINKQLLDAKEEEDKWVVNVDTTTVLHMSESEMRNVFNKFDVDSSGSIDINELQHAMNEMGIQNINKENIGELIDEIDENGDGEVDFNEFKKMVGQTWFDTYFQNNLFTSTKRMMTSMNLFDGIENENENNEFENENQDLFSDVDENDIDYNGSIVSTPNFLSTPNIDDFEDLEEKQRDSYANINNNNWIKEKEKIEKMYKIEIETLQQVVENLRNETIELKNELEQVKNKQENENINNNNNINHTARNNNNMMEKLIGDTSGGICSSWWG